MKLIEPKVELILQEPGIEGVYKQIELVGRSCWMSQDHIKEGSAELFVKNLVKNTHTSCLEHGTVYLTIPYAVSKREYPHDYLPNCVGDYVNNKYSKVKTVWPSDDCACDCVTTNYRVLVENGWLDDLKYLSNPTIYHSPRLTFHFTCSRAISAEFNRHRANSPMESSTRYCNFSKDKFGNEISICPSIAVVHPEEFKDVNQDLLYFCDMIAHEMDNQFDRLDWWTFANLACERTYMELLKQGMKAEEARDILPLDLKTELYHTAFVEDWIHFCNLRAIDSPGNKPHPEAKRLARQVLTYLYLLDEAGTIDIRKYDIRGQISTDK